MNEVNALVDATVLPGGCATELTCEYTKRCHHANTVVRFGSAARCMAGVCQQHVNECEVVLAHGGRERE